VEGAYGRVVERET